jgi:putative Flp pilus-assembly TadE/G-like protein
VRRHEEGQVLPALLVLFLALVALGGVLLQAGRTSTMRAHGQTAADAAALAGAREIERQLSSPLADLGPVPQEKIGPDLVSGLLDQGPSPAPPIEAAERDYAVRNGARLVGAARPGPLDVEVAVETNEGPGRVVARARARVVVTFVAPSSSPVDPLDYIRFDVRLASPG